MFDRDFIFSSESVSDGHPDKLADQISDAVLDAALTRDPKARVACETITNTGLVMLAGEITCSQAIPYAEIVREVIRDVGYTDSRIGFDAETCAVLTTIDRQSADINQGVDRSAPEEQGAGDQGIVFGFACRETDVLMPMPITYAHDLVRELSNQRKAGAIEWLRPDAKAQVSVRYEAGTPKEIDTVVLSSQHDPYTDTLTEKSIQEQLTEEVIYKIIPQELRAKDMKICVNPTGKFVIGGPMGDCGLTGRKLIVDTYGGMGRHGGGAFSGKDPSKTDRSAAYMARYIAKNIVAAGLAERCELQLAYAIGVAEPVSVFVETFGTGKIDEEKIEALVREHFSLTPYGITQSLDLERPIYRPTATFGHFGREDIDVPWEKTDKAQILADAANIEVPARVARGA